MQNFWPEQQEHKKEKPDTTINLSLFVIVCSDKTQCELLLYMYLQLSPLAQQGDNYLL